MSAIVDWGSLGDQINFDLFETEMEILPSGRVGTKKKVFEDVARVDNKCAFFGSPVTYCLKYGEAYATSENLEGIAAWLPGDFADMSMWRMIRSGAISRANMKY